MSNRSEQVNLRITESRKEEWDAFAEESRAVDGVSDLVRRGVTAYIQAGGDPTAVETPSGTQSSGRSVPDNLSGRLASIEDELRDVSSTVDRVDERADFIERKLVEGDRETSFKDLLLRAIPPAKPGTERWESLRDEYGSTPRGEPIVWEGTVSAFMDSLGDEDPQTDESLIQQSLEAIHRGEDIDLEAETLDGERRYWAERDLEKQPYADGRRADQRTEQVAYSRRQERR